MWRAWCEVAANQGAPGVDGVTIDALAADGVPAVQEFLGELARRLRDRSYRPAPLRRVWIPKPGKPGQQRPLSIPTVADRVVMTAAKLILEPIWEADFLPVSFGFRPRRSAHGALEVVRVEANRGRDWVLDADVSDCFDKLDHDHLMSSIGLFPARGMVRAWLKAGVFEPGKGFAPTEDGSPQGGVISPLLLNVALHGLEEAAGVRYRTGASAARIERNHPVVIRYADDRAPRTLKEGPM